MRKALGLIEVFGFTCAVDVADVMIKTANIEIERIEITKGLGYVMVAVRGDVGAVNAAIHAGKIAACDQKAFISSKVLARPIDLIYANTIKKEKVIEKNKEISTTDVTIMNEVVTPIEKSNPANKEVSKPNISSKVSTKKSKIKKDVLKSENAKIPKKNKTTKKTEE